MNALDARSMSNKNLPKLVEKNLNIAVTNINNLVKNATQNGEFKTQIRVSLPSNIHGDVIKRLHSHYRELGYETLENSFGEYCTFFSVAWLEKE